MKYIYGVFAGSKWATMTTLKDVQEFRRDLTVPSTVRRMPYKAWVNDDGPYGWDAPTFRVMSELVEG